MIPFAFASIESFPSPAEKQIDRHAEELGEIINLYIRRDASAGFDIGDHLPGHVDAQLPKFHRHVFLRPVPLFPQPGNGRSHIVEVALHTDSRCFALCFPDWLAPPLRTQVLPRQIQRSYSNRSVVIGSIFVARLAGSQQARPTASSRTTEAMKYAVRSNGLTSDTKWRSTHAPAQAAGKPEATPAPANPRPNLKINFATSDRRAPTARRRPISRRRCTTR